MGVPSFFRWLSQRYPRIVKDVIETQPDAESTSHTHHEVKFNGEFIKLPIDLSTENPNAEQLGGEIDNLYLDLNGVIHPCCHPEDSDAPANEDEMIAAIYRYLDRILAMARPRRLLYMAIDGVAPRAKMNQQRSRRFRAAKEMSEAQQVEDDVRAQFARQGIEAPPRKRKPWDSNVITPGTPFMHRISQALHYWIADRLASQPGLRNTKIIFSDARVPGEGEHKIMAHLRLQRAQPGYDANQMHCLYGMDADLIMLGLATHEVKFLILRETVTPPNNNQKCAICGQTGHYTDACKGEARVESADDTIVTSSIKPFQMLVLSTLREYLAVDLEINQPMSFPYSLERCIDDFVFLCLFVGNDFLPHLPSLEIREGAIERLVNLYKKLLPSLGGYLTECGHIDLSRADILLTELGVLEDSIFRQRKSKEEFFKRRDAQRVEKIAWIRAQNDKVSKAKRITEFAVDVGGFKALGGSIHDSYLKKEGVAVKKRKADELNNKSQTGVKKIEPAKSQQQLAAAKKLAAPTPAPVVAAAPLNMNDANKAAAKALRAKLAGNNNNNTAAAAPVSTAKAEAAPTTVKPEVKSSKPEPELKTAATTQAATTATPIDSKIAKRFRIDDKGNAVASPIVEPIKSDSSPIKPEATAEIEAAADAADEDDDDDALSISSVSSSLSDDVDPTDAQAQKLQATILAQHKKAKAALQSAVNEADKTQVDFTELLNSKLKALAEPGANEDGTPSAAAKDSVQLGTDGWRERYYLSKLQASLSAAQDRPVLDKLFRSYTEGLCWVMLYYYQGCASWSWYYPFHYAPMASDLMNLDNYKVNFELSQPFAPIEQLMGVLPAASAHCMPSACRQLMTDEKSVLADFYPTDFPLDLNGKKYLWQAVALLPWIDEKRLQLEMRKAAATFSEDEKLRNSRGYEYLYVHARHDLANSLIAMYSNKKYSTKTIRKLPSTQREAIRLPIDSMESQSLTGFMSPYVDALIPGENEHMSAVLPQFDALEQLPVVSCIYNEPELRPHVCDILPTAVMPAPSLSDHDIQELKSRKPAYEKGGGGRHHGGGPRLVGGEAPQFIQNQNHWHAQQQAIMYGGKLPPPPPASQMYQSQPPQQHQRQHQPHQQQQQPPPQFQRPGFGYAPPQQQQQQQFGMQQPPMPYAPHMQHQQHAYAPHQQQQQQAFYPPPQHNAMPYGQQQAYGAPQFAPTMPYAMPPQGYGAPAGMHYPPMQGYAPPQQPQQAYYGAPPAAAMQGYAPPWQQQQQQMPFQHQPPQGPPSGNFFSQLQQHNNRR